MYPETNVKGMSMLRRLFVRHRSRLLLTYSLFALEMLGSLLRPYFLGEAVNDLIAGSYRGLILLSIVHFAYLGVGTVRHMVDTRTYTDIYTSLVMKMLSRRFEDEDVSRLSAHSNLAREFIDFLQYDLNFIIEAAYNIFGSLILLFFYEKSVVLACLAILLPVCWLGYRYGRSMKRLTKFKNDELELQVDVIYSECQGDQPALPAITQMADQDRGQGSLEFRHYGILGIAGHHRFPADHGPSRGENHARR